MAGQRLLISSSAGAARNSAGSGEFTTVARSGGSGCSCGSSGCCSCWGRGGGGLTDDSVGIIIIEGSGVLLGDVRETNQEDDKDDSDGEGETVSDQSLGRAENFSPRASGVLRLFGVVEVAVIRDTLLLIETIGLGFIERIRL